MATLASIIKDVDKDVKGMHEEKESKLSLRFNSSRFVGLVDADDV